MKVLIIVPTYGRIPFLNRVVASFISQDYDDKELVIINDDKNVYICCETKGVTCINLNKKILVGQKRNIATQLGYHDLYIPHDDDDIFLPTRTSRHVEFYSHHPDVSMYHDKYCYIIYGTSFHVNGSGPSCISFTRKAWFDVGGYLHPLNSGEDQEFRDKIKNYMTTTDKDVIDYIYNFGGLNYHLSCASDNDIERIAYKQLVDMDLLNKKYYIEPDFDEYNKFIELDKLFKAHNSPINIRHQGLGKIEIIK